MEPREGEPWPVERDAHAACCLGYAGDHIHLLVTGGLGKDNKTLRDIWLFNLSLKKWKEVRHIIVVQACIVQVCILTKLSLVCRTYGSRSIFL